MTQKTRITSTDMLSAAREILLRNGFREATLHYLKDVDRSNQALYEDPYSLVAIVVFATWSDLLRDWPEAQASFVELISENISRDESKTWDCYLLLWTTDLFPRDKSEERQAIRYNTGRVRKLIASGAEIRDLGDVSTALLPLLPITESTSASMEESVLDRIPTLLESEAISQLTIRNVIDAFHKRESLVEALHKSGGEQ
jgi:hypothetical protein